MSLKTATLRMPQRRPKGRIISRNLRSPYKGAVRSRTPAASPVQILVGALCLFLLLLGGWTSYQVKVVADQVEALRTEAVRLETQNERLVQVHKTLTSKDNLEKIGRRLGLHPPKKEQLILLK